MRIDRSVTPLFGPGILVVDDEPVIQGLISRALAAAGYTVRCASGGAEALCLADMDEYGLVILDLVIPDMDGREVLAGLMRAHPDQAVLVLSCLDDTATKVACLDLGARDYLTKPFSLLEMLARVRVQLRRDPHHEVLRSGELSLDAGRLQANVGQGPVALTRLEFLLLRELMERSGHLVPKEQLLASVWGYDFDPGSNVVDVCVRRLRSKLGFDLIRTVRGAGYQLMSSGRRPPTGRGAGPGRVRPGLPGAGWRPAASAVAEPQAESAGPLGPSPQGRPQRTSGSPLERA